MKKIIIIASIAAAALLICGFSGMGNLFAKEEVKDINLSVYKTASYDAPAYKDAYASLNVTVYRIKGNKKELLWKHNYNATQLKNYPGADKPFQQKVAIKDITDSRAKIEVCYSLSYNTKGSVINFCNTEVIGKKEKAKIVNIHI
mgnify:CR=1 FL=1